MGGRRRPGRSAGAPGLPPGLATGACHRQARPPSIAIRTAEGVRGAGLWSSGASGWQVARQLSMHWHDTWAHGAVLKTMVLCAAVGAAAHWDDLSTGLLSLSGCRAAPCSRTRTLDASTATRVARRWQGGSTLTIAAPPATDNDQPWALDVWSPMFVTAVNKLFRVHRNVSMIFHKVHIKP